LTIARNLHPHADDLGDRQLVVDEQIADRYLSLGFRVQTRGIGGSRNFSPRTGNPW